MDTVVTHVIGITPETPDAVTIRLDLGGVPFSYHPGQYLQIDPHQFEELAAPLAQLEAEKGMPESPRAFSISSDASEARSLEISVKEERQGRYAPLLTPFLVRQLAPGRKITLSGPSGRYFIPEPPAGVSAFLHVCAGSGVAPNRGMIRSALARGWPQKHLLMLQNRTQDDVFYRSEWPKLSTENPDRFRVHHLFSKTRGEHLTPEIVRKAMEGFFDIREAFALVCGPNRPREVVMPDGAKAKQPGFCEHWIGNPRRKSPGLLGSLGFPPDRILSEMW